MSLSPSWGPLTTSTATFPLPTVINKATSPSLQDPGRKITTSSCSTLPYHVLPTPPGAQPAGKGTLCWSPGGGCCQRINTSCCPLPSLPSKKWNLSANFTPLVPVGDSHKRAGGTAPVAAVGSLRGWAMWGAAGHLHNALPRSSSSQPVPVLSHPQTGPAELQRGTWSGPCLESGPQGGVLWGPLEVTSFTSVPPTPASAFWQKVALGQRRLCIRSSLCWGVKRRWWKAISSQNIQAAEVFRREGRRGTKDKQKGFREPGVDPKRNW